MPGVSVITDTWAGPVSTPSPAHAAYFVTGLTERGPVGSVQRITSLGEYEAFFGVRVAYGNLHDDLRVFFAEGGGEAYVSRVVGDAATNGFLVLKDKGADTGVDTLRVEAAAPGAWSTGLSVDSAAGTAGGSYKLTLSYQGDVIARYDNLVTPGDAVAAAAGSKWVKITDLGSVTAAPANQPKVITASLSAGTDDRGSIDSDSIEAALAVFGRDLGAGAVAAPGLGATLAGDALIAHATGNDRIALLAGDNGDETADAIADAATFIDAGHEAAGYFYPWLTIPDGSTTKAVSPEGFVAGVRARTIRLNGAWKVPAGIRGQATYVLGPVTQLTKAEGDELDDNQVSAIRTIAGTTRLYGWRSLSSDAVNFATLNARDTLNYLSVICAAVVEQYVFETIDPGGQLLSKIAASLVGVVDPVRAAGGLFERLDKISGQRLDPGYAVNVGDTVNTDETIANNEIHALITVRIAPTGQEITIEIIKASQSAGL